MMLAATNARPVMAASFARVSNVEFDLLVVVVVLVVLLLLTRAWRSHDLKRRKAAGAGYYDSDAARFGPGGSGGGTAERPVAAGPPSLAPSFSAAAEAPSVAKATLVDPLPPSGPTGPATPPDLPSTLPLLVQPPPPPRSEN